MHKQKEYIAYGVIVVIVLLLVYLISTNSTLGHTCTESMNTNGEFKDNDYYNSGASMRRIGQLFSSTNQELK